MDQAPNHISIDPMLLIHPANRQVSEEESAPRSSDESDPKPDEVEEATLPRHRRIAQRLSWMIKTPRVNERASSAASVHTRDDASLDLSYKARQTTRAKLRNAIVRFSGIGAPRQEASSDVATGTTEDPAVRLRRSVVISDQVERLKSETSASHYQESNTTDQLGAEANELPATEHGGQQLDEKQPPALQSRQARRWTMFDRLPSNSFATRNQSPLPQSCPAGNAQNKTAGESNVPEKKRRQRRSLATMFSRMARQFNGPSHQSTSHNQNQNNEEGPHEGPSSDSTDSPHLAEENAYRGLDAPLPVSDVVPQHPLPSRGTLDFRLDLQSGVLSLMRSQTQRTQRRIVGTTLKGISRGTIRRKDWHLGEEKNVVPYTTDPENEELYYTARSEPIPALPAVPADIVDTPQGYRITMRSGRKVWLPHQNKRELADVDKAKNKFDAAHEVEVEDAMNALEWADHQSGGEHDVEEHDHVKDEDKDLRPSDSALGNNVEDERKDDDVEGEHQKRTPCGPRLREFVEIGGEDLLPDGLRLSVRNP